MSGQPWDLWVDYHRTDGARLTHTNLRNAEPGAAIQVGRCLVVGNEEAESAVAEVVSVDDRGVVLVRVLPGRAADHLDLVSGGAICSAG